MEVKIGDKVYELEKPSGYKLLKAVGEDKDPADITRDLILLTVKEPKLTKKDVEEMDPETFFTLGAKINELIGEDLKKLEVLRKSSEK
ncbi:MULTISPECIES: hypothetical protein [unclassified Archaeoglobus]|jgi:hypothetical protein|uniref:hypothetical protein n=1 Tax=unclassified Archaeoglobus TaxID=2643606 RepID=UPI0025C109CB|nr:MULTISPECIES: hypothetical protein [unclassified Archaeoglobus]